MYHHIIWYNKIRNDEKLSEYQMLIRVEEALKRDTRGEQGQLDERCPFLLPFSHDPGRTLPFFLLNLANEFNELRRLEKVYLNKITDTTVKYRWGIRDKTTTISNNPLRHCGALISRWLGSNRTINKIREIVHETVLILRVIGERRGGSNMDQEYESDGFDSFYEEEYLPITVRLMKEMHQFERKYGEQMGTSRLREVLYEDYEKYCI